MDYRPNINTNIGPGRLFRIVGDMAHVEFDYMYLVELPLSNICLQGVDLAKVEGGGDIDERLERTAIGRKGG